MVKEGTRKCSHCRLNGHNSRTCNGKGCFKLFGVTIMEKPQEHSIMKKSHSMGNLQSLADNSVVVDAGYLSDGQIHSSRANLNHERRKAKPWTEEEHRIFLTGLKKLGKGDWKGISENYVTSRSPSQVASHAQKYFLRQTSNDKRKRRASVFDMALNQPDLQAPVPEDSPVVPLVENAKCSSEASTSSVLQSKNTTGIPAQAITPAEVSDRFPHLCLEDRPVNIMSAASSVPNYHGIQHQLEAPGNGQSSLETNMMPYPSFYTAMNYMRPGYGCMPKTLGNFASWAPVIAHPSGIPPPPTFPTWNVSGRPWNFIN